MCDSRVRDEEHHQDQTGGCPTLVIAALDGTLYAFPLT
jgi:hypothetical protein